MVVYIITHYEKKNYLFFHYKILIYCLMFKRIRNEALPPETRLDSYLACDDTEPYILYLIIARQ